MSRGDGVDTQSMMSHQRSLTSLLQLDPLASQHPQRSDTTTLQHQQHKDGNTDNSPVFMQRAHSEPSTYDAPPSHPSSHSAAPLNAAEMKHFDPLASISPLPPHPFHSSNAADMPPQLAIQPYAPIQSFLSPIAAPQNTLTSSSSSIAGSSGATTSAPLSTSITNSTPTNTMMPPGQTGTISINSYSSAALSSGTFTAISVSPSPTDVASHSSASHQNHHQQQQQLHSPALPHNNSTLSIPTHHSHVSISGSASALNTPMSTSSVLSPTLQASPLSVPGALLHSDGQHDPSPLGTTTSSSAIAPTAASSTSSTLSSPPTSINPASVPTGVLSPSHPSIPPDSTSPLPPVVSALMAAQKLSGTTPGATLAVPSASSQPSGRLLFICGDASGAGKSCVAMGLLHLLLKRGYQPHELAYIKPCTQCEDVQIVWKYCEKMKIPYQGRGPVIFYEGFTAEVIDGTAESVERRRVRIQNAVNKIAEGKKWVLVDGVGYAAVGSVAGVSNAEVASELNAPVLIVGRPGLGNAIDSMNFMLAYFEKFHVQVLGACWNKIPPQHSYHSFEKSREYVQKYFKVIRNGIISTYGHIPLVPLPPPPSTNTAESTVSPTPSSTVAAGASSASAPALAPGTVTCRLRATKTDLTLDSIEEEFISAFCKLMEEYFDIETLLFDLNKYYAKLVKLVSVV